MSGQRPDRRLTGPAYNAPQAPDAGPSVQTQQGTFRPAQTEAPVQGIARVGEALASFFGTAQKTAEALDEVQHRENLLTIKRQNEARELQAQADALEGKPLDQEQAQYWSYFGTFARTNGRVRGAEDAQAWADIVQKAPTDGSWDYEAEAKKFLEERYGSGSGEDAHDAAYLATWKNAADTLRQQFSARLHKTQQNAAATAFVNNAQSIVSTYQGAPDGMIDGMFAEAVSIAQGDPAAANALMHDALSKAVLNRGQAQSILLGVSGSEWGKKNPAMYAALTDAAWKRVTEVQSVETYQAIDTLRQRALELSTRKDATLDDFFTLIADVKDSARRLGGERAHDAIIGNLIGEAQQRFAKEAKVNAWLNTIEGNGTYVAAWSGGVKPADYAEGFAVGFNRWAEMQAHRFPALVQGRREGAIDHAATPEHATQFARLIADPRFVQASPEPVPPAYKKQINADILGSNPQRAANTYWMLSEVEKLQGPDYVYRILDDDAKRVYQRVRRAEAFRQRPEEYFATRVENPGRDKVLDGIESGDLKWVPLVGGKDEAEARAKVDQVILSKLLEHEGLKKFWSFLPFVSDPKLSIPDDRLMNTLRSEIALSLADQRATGADKLSLDEATSLMVERMAGKLLVRRGRDGNLQVVQSPYGPDEGRAVKAPLAQIGDRHVYALGRVKNAEGEWEDTNETAFKDFKALAERFPLQGYVPEKLALGAYREGPAKGLWDLHHNGQGVEFPLGGKVTVREYVETKRPAVVVRGAVGGEITERKPVDTEVAIPSEPSEAVAFFNERLKDTGFYAEPSTVFGRPTVRLVYGPRVEKGIEWEKKTLAEKEAQRRAYTHMTPEQAERVERFNEVQRNLVDPSRLSGARYLNGGNGSTSN